MATIAIGDIHGNLTALTDLLHQLEPEIADGDTVVFLGDYLDRGPDSKGCIDAILEFISRASATVVCLLGNHEGWFLDTRADYRQHLWLLGMDGLDTIRSYSPDAAEALQDAKAEAGAAVYEGRVALPYEVFFDHLPAAHIAFFEHLVPFHRTADCLCVHAGVGPAEVKVEDQPVDTLIWGHASFPESYGGPGVVVYGHHDNAELGPDQWPEPCRQGRTVGIDTISHGVLTAIRLPDMKIWQSARYLVAG